MGKSNKKKIKEHYLTKFVYTCFPTIKLVEMEKDDDHIFYLMGTSYGLKARVKYYKGPKIWRVSRVLNSRTTLTKNILRLRLDNVENPDVTGETDKFCALYIEGDDIVDID